MSDLIRSMIDNREIIESQVTGGLTEEEIMEGVREYYTSVAKTMGLSEDKQKAYVDYMSERFGGKKLSHAFSRRLAQDVKDGKIPSDRDSEGKKIKKLTEEEEITPEDINFGGPSKEEVSKEEEPKKELSKEKEPPKKPSKEEKPKEEKPEDKNKKKEKGEEKEKEIEKEHVGSKGEDFFYMLTVTNDAGEVEDLQIVDQDEKKVFSAKDNDLDIIDVPAFVLEAAKKADIDEISRDLFVRYILPMIEEEEEEKLPSKEEIEGELGKEEFEEFAPFEESFNYNNKKCTIKLLEHTSDGIKIFLNGKDFSFSSRIAEMHQNKAGKITSEGLKRLGSNVLKYSKEEVKKDILERKGKKRLVKEMRGGGPDTAVFSFEIVNVKGERLYASVVNRIFKKFEKILKTYDIYDLEIEEDYPLHGGRASLKTSELSGVIHATYGPEEDLEDLTGLEEELSFVEGDIKVTVDEFEIK